MNTYTLKSIAVASTAYILGKIIDKTFDLSISEKKYETELKKSENIYNINKEFYSNTVDVINKFIKK
jgi:hypothetical protein